MPEPEHAGAPRQRGGAVARLSLEYKLPLLIGGLLLVVIAAFAGTTYAEMRRGALRTANERLEGVTNQFRDLFRQYGVQTRAQATVTALRPAIGDYLRLRDARSRARALVSLDSAVAQPEQVVASELRDSSGAILLTTRLRSGADTIAIANVIDRVRTTDSAALGRLRVLRDTIVYAVVAPVRGAHGYVVRWRQIAGTRQARQELARLIGSEAQLLLGNTDGSRWSDLERPVPGPGGEALLAAIPGTPWSVAVSFPRDIVLAPVDRFLKQLVSLALVALGLGLVAAWFASRRLTIPLRQLTHASGAIANGDFSVSPRIDRADELGQLGTAFGAMAAEISESRAGLEAKVEQRTRDLERILAQLQDAQSALVRREKLAMLGQLAGGVGHELRNPLGVMTNAVYYLKMMLASQPENIQEYLDILQQQITLSEKIVTDLLDFARSKPSQRAFVSLEDVAAAQIARLGATNGVRIDAKLPNDLPPVFVDRVQIGQIVLNLLTNAVQAMDGTGTVSVRLGSNDDSAFVEIADTGPGIPLENLDKIFEPLFTTKARGIGLGLAVSRTLARSNEGDLTVSSMPGDGATFRLTLPLRQGGAA